MKKEFPKREGDKRPRKTSLVSREGGFRPKSDNGTSRSFSKSGSFENREKKPYEGRNNNDSKFNNDRDSRPARPSYSPKGSFDNSEKRSFRDNNSDKTFDRKFSRNGDAPRKFEGEPRPFKREFNSDKPTGFNKDKKPFNKDFNREGASDKPFYKKPFDESKKRNLTDCPDGFTKRPAYNEKPQNPLDGEKPAFKKRFEGPYQPNLNQDTGGSRYNSGRDKYRSDGRPWDNDQRAQETIEEKSGTVRLNRYIANSGICSRRDADELIQAGQISVNNEVITEMGYQVKFKDVVKYGKKLLTREKMVYLLVNKPKDYITTTEDPQDRRTIMHMVEGVCKERIYPVGRLDRNTTGLLLLTNDGELAAKLTHPSNQIEKTYQVELNKAITDADFEAIKKGITLEDGDIKADDLAIITPDAMVVGITIHSGRNHIVRRIFAHLGYEVMKLDRTVFAGLNKKDLPRGKWRFLSEKEIIKLKYLN